MWKIHYGYIKTPILKLFTKNLQNEQKYVLPHPRNEKGKNQFVYTCVKAWNTVPEDIKKITLFKSFTTRYKEFLLGGDD